MAQNEYCVETAQGEIRVFGANENSVILASQIFMSKQMEALFKQVKAMSMRQVQVQRVQVQRIQQAQVLRCEFCGEGHVRSECVPKIVSEKTNYMENYIKKILLLKHL